MISPSYNIRESIEAAKDKSFAEIVLLAERETYEAEHRFQGTSEGQLRLAGRVVHSTLPF